MKDHPPECDAITEMDTVFKGNIKNFQQPIHQKLDPSHEIGKALNGDILNCRDPYLKNEPVSGGR